MKEKTDQIIKSTVLSIGALLLLNGVLQLILYPYLTKRMGASAFGDVLAVLSIIAIVAPAAGLAVNNSRLVAQVKHPCSNGDAILVLLLLMVPSILVTLAYLYYDSSFIDSAIGLSLLTVFTTFRYYSDVEYRLHLNYSRYFIYYLVVSAGYVLGILLYPQTHSWIITITIGEALGVIYNFFTGSLYTQSLKVTPYIGQFLKDCITLWLSYVLYNAVLNLDRVLLKIYLDNTMVTIYYVSSLMGKMIAMLVGPLNSVVLSFLSKNKDGINRKNFLFFAFIALAISAVFYCATYVCTPIFAKIAYGEIAQLVVQYSPLANLSQIICFAGSFLMTVMLIIVSNKWQIIIQLIYTALFLFLSYVMCQFWGLNGFIIGILISNISRFFMIVAIGCHFTSVHYS